MAKCEDVQAELSAYLDGELSVEEKHALDAHLCLCDACNAVLGELESVRASLGALPKLKAPATLARDVRQKISAERLPIPLPAARKV
jgi:anti-sigma factor RsiW